MSTNESSQVSRDKLQHGITLLIASEPNDGRSTGTPLGRCDDGGEGAAQTRCTKSRPCQTLALGGGLCGVGVSWVSNVRLSAACWAGAHDLVT